jgi:DNA-binding transcriptional MocR family regulator
VEEEMISVDQRAAIRHAYYHEHKSVRQIARDLKCSRKTVDKAIDSAEPAPYTRTVPRESPKLAAFHTRIDELLAEQARQPRKQRYTSHKIFEICTRRATLAVSRAFAATSASANGPPNARRSFCRSNSTLAKTPRSIGARPSPSSLGALDGATVRDAAVLLAPHLRYGLRPSARRRL